jgi:hypothetical protein
LMISSRKPKEFEVNLLDHNFVQQESQSTRGSLERIQVLTA